MHVIDSYFCFNLEPKWVRGEMINIPTYYKDKHLQVSLNRAGIKKSYVTKLNIITNVKDINA